jgi:hypothetical protein
MFSLDRLNNLIEEKGFVPNNYFTHEGVYKLVELVGLRSAISLVVTIPSKYRINATNQKYEYEIVAKTLSDVQASLYDDASLRRTYKEIDHVARLLESEEKLHEIYDQPISLAGEEVKSVEKFASTVRQMKRFRLCVKSIPFKLLIIDDDCLCLLNEENEIETYFASDYRNRHRKIFVTTSLENFFKTPDIEKSIASINEQFSRILSENHHSETLRIQQMIDGKRNIVKQSQKILALKKALEGEITGLRRKHGTLGETYSGLDKKRRGLAALTPSTVNAQAQVRAQIQRIGEEMAKNEVAQQEIIKSILEKTKKLDEMNLVVDSVLFDSMTMLTKIQDNFRVLDLIGA